MRNMGIGMIKMKEKAKAKAKMGRRGHVYQAGLRGSLHGLLCVSGTDEILIVHNISWAVRGGFLFYACIFGFKRKTDGDKEIGIHI